MKTTTYNTQGKVIFNFHSRPKGNINHINTLLTGTKGYFSLLVKPCEVQRVCEFSHKLMDYTVQTISGKIVAKVAFQKDAKTLITILEGQTYSKKGLTWNKASANGNTYIHLKDTSMIAPSLLKEVVELLPKSVKVLKAGDIQGRARKARRAY